MLETVQRLLPRPVRRYILHFETAIEEAVARFASAMPEGAWVLDAGCGECKYKRWFSRQRYVGIDLGIGDAAWNYATIDAVADLGSIPFRSGSFEAALNLVTLEHVREPALVLAEILRVLSPGGRLLLILPHEWEEHQTPHDYFRYTRYGAEYLLRRVGFEDIRIEPVGGFFRLLSRRLLNGLQFFPPLLLPLAAIFLGGPALVFPLLDGLDRRRNFTLGYICTARKPS
ncbi:MAG TPA: methyltransferase domain-containing protein [Bryobacteraceae bacterium]|jgi:SAM-dependent methyltransferase|nr:methyltransferase domain-containing protein [Bryobacteraceae bacterium]